MKSLKTLFLSAVAVLTMASAAKAQGAFSADWVSAYVWRGVPQTGASFQPGYAYTVSGLTLGVWASYPIAGGQPENDLYVSYSLPVAEGHTIGLIATDYIYPARSATDKFFDFSDSSTAHTVELGLTYSGMFSFLAAVNVYGDDDNSVYTEIGLPVAGEGVSYNYFVGAAIGGSTINPADGTFTGWYLKKNDNLNVINLGFSATKTIKVTETFSIPAKFVFGLNPESEVSYVTFGFTL